MLGFAGEWGRFAPIAAVWGVLWLSRVVVRAHGRKAPPVSILYIAVAVGPIGEFLVRGLATCWSGEPLPIATLRCNQAFELFLLITPYCVLTAVSLAALLFAPRAFLRFAGSEMASFAALGAIIIQMTWPFIAIATGDHS